MNTFKTKFIDVKLDQKEFSQTSVKAVKEIYASKFQIAKHNVKALDFRKCLSALRELKNNKLTDTVLPTSDIV
jgi:hypothetical protein|tara:strand:+ start:1210 stop:1428 length:219 start_codon:yes stop_codon:yes gene_type:complete